MSTATKAKAKAKAGVHARGDSLGLCQILAAQLKGVGPEIPVSAIAGWSPDMRQEVHEWLDIVEVREKAGGGVQSPDPPDWLVETHALSMALEPDDEAEESWQTLVRDGASNSTILSLVGIVLAEQGVDFAGTDFGPVCWSIDPNGYTSIWFREEHPPRREADLEGKALAQAVRDLYGIKFPPPSVNDHPELRGAPPRAAPAESSDTDRPPAAAGSSDMNRSAAPVATLEIPPELIERFPANPRDELEFDEAELRELGADLARRQVQACVVRAIAGGRYQLIAGERRWRSALLVRLPALRCEVVEVTDAEAMWMCGVENEQRSEWSAIARARWYRAVREAEGLTVEQLAVKAGVSQGHVSSCLGLLELPDDWQRRVISREISGTAVRPLIPWAKRRPAVLEQVAKELRLPGSGVKEERKADEKISVRAMEDAVQVSLSKLTRSMDRQGYGPGAPLFGITAARKKLLDCEQLKVSNWQGAVSRAWNTVEWDRLQREAKKKQKEKAGDAGAVSRREETTNDWGVSRWLAGWLAELIAPRIGDDAAGQLLALRILAVADAMDAVRLEDFSWEATASLTADSLLAMMPEAVREAMRERYWHDDLLAEIATGLGIDLAAEFRPDAGLLTCFGLDDLRKFAGAGKAQKELPKPELIDYLLANWKAGWLPPLVKKSLGLKVAGRKKAVGK